MALTWDTYRSYQADNPAGTSFDIDNVTCDGVNRLLLVFITVNFANNEDVTAVAWDADGVDEALIELCQINNSDDAYAAIWYKIAPTTGTNKVVRVTTAATPTFGVMFGAVCAYGAAQTGTFNTYETATGNTAKMTTGSMASADDETCVGCAFGETATSCSADSPSVAFANGSPISGSSDVAGHARSAGDAGGVTMEWTISSDHWAAAGVSIRELLASSEQEGFRFYDDDDDEASSTPLEDQDTDLTIGKETNFRTRMLTDFTGDPASATAELQYRVVGDPATEWRKVPET